MEHKRVLNVLDRMAHDSTTQHDLEQSLRSLPDLSTAKTSATHRRGSLRCDNGPLSLAPVITFHAARPTPLCTPAGVPARVIQRALVDVGETERPFGCGSDDMQAAWDLGGYLRAACRSRRHRP